MSINRIVSTQNVSFNNVSVSGLTAPASTYKKLLLFDENKAIQSGVTLDDANKFIAGDGSLKTVSTTVTSTPDYVAFFDNLGDLSSEQYLALARGGLANNFATSGANKLLSINSSNNNYQAALLVNANVDTNADIARDKLQPDSSNPYAILMNNSDGDIRPSSKLFMSSDDANVLITAPKITGPTVLDDALVLNAAHFQIDTSNYNTPVIVYTAVVPNSKSAFVKFVLEFTNSSGDNAVISSEFKCKSNGSGVVSKTASPYEAAQADAAFANYVLSYDVASANSCIVKLQTNYNGTTSINGRFEQLNSY